MRSTGSGGRHPPGRADGRRTTKAMPGLRDLLGRTTPAAFLCSAHWQSSRAGERPRSPKPETLADGAGKMPARPPLGAICIRWQQYIV